MHLWLTLYSLEDCGYFYHDVGCLGFDVCRTGQDDTTAISAPPLLFSANELSLKTVRILGKVYMSMFRKVFRALFGGKSESDVASAAADVVEAASDALQPSSGSQAPGVVDVRTPAAPSSPASASDASIPLPVSTFPGPDQRGGGNVDAPESTASAEGQIPAAETAVVLAAHGERGGDMKNASLHALVGTLLTQGTFKSVGGGVLNGTPSLGDALATARASGAKQILVYPLFMSDGYFVDTKLPEEISAAGCEGLAKVMAPLGSDDELVALMLRRAAVLARDERMSPANTRLLVVGHGSKSGKPASAAATKRFAGSLRGRGVFRTIDVAYLEEAPLLADVLKASDQTTIVLGYFFAPGLHAAEDVPNALAQSGADAIYAGAVGGDVAVGDVILNALAEEAA